MVSTLKGLLRVRLLAAAAWSLGLSSCKPVPPESDMSSIETLTSGGNFRKQEWCGPNLPHSTPADTIAKVWEALPPRLKHEFSSKADYFVTDIEASIHCLNDVFKQLAPAHQLSFLSSAESCWALHGSGMAARPRVILAAHPIAINEHMIAQATLAYTEFYIDYLLGRAIDQAKQNGISLRKGEAQVAKFVDDFRIARLLLAKAFNDDMHDSGNRAVINRYAQLFSASESMLHESVDYQNYILAQLVDAYYCSNKTAHQFNLNPLVRTRGAFLQFVDFFGAPWYAGQGKSYATL